LTAPSLYCMITYRMRVIVNKSRLSGFDWDKGNIDKNLKRHRVNYKECEEIFFNKPLKTFYDKVHSRKEKRFVAYGETNRERKLFLVFTIRNKRIRIISARDMSRKERRYYEQK